MSRNISIKNAYCGSMDDDAFKVPREIGCYSIDAQEEIHYDRSQLKYYIPRVNNKDLQLDLNVGYENTIRYEHNSLKNMHTFLKWIVYSDFEPLNRVDFVATRGTVTRLLCTPFDSNHWIICASKVGDVIYFTRIDTEEKIEKDLNATEMEKRMSAWGYKFENYMTSDKPKGILNTSSITHEIEKYHTVVTNEIGTHKLLLTAEVDAIDASKSLRLRRGDPTCYMELKTSKMQRNFRSTYHFKKYKSLQWWAQSVIIGVEDNVCGLRDDEGIVYFIASFKTRELPFMCQNLWSPDVCFNFSINFMKYLKKHVKDNPRIVYKFEYVGGPHVFVTKLKDPEERYQVIPDWYLTDLLKYGHLNKTKIVT